jgi:hypothetical protein
MGADDFEFTVIGNAGTIRLLFGPDGGSLTVDDAASADRGIGAEVWETGPRASDTEGLESFGGVGPGAGDAVDRGVGLLPTIVSCALSFTGSSFGACRLG